MKTNLCHISNTIRWITLLIACVLLGTTRMQAEEYDIYLLIGQSNMAGRGTLIDSDTTQMVEGVWLLDSIGAPVKACAPFNRYSTIRKDIKFQGVSPANNFSKLMHQRTGRKILLVVNARGGSSLGQWLPEDKHGFFNEALRRTRQAVKYGDLKGILWHQGETDVQKGRTSDYAERFNTFITALRDSLGEGDNIPVVIGQLGQWKWAPMDDINTFNDSVVPAICATVPNCRYVSSHRLKRLFNDKESDPHFSRDAQIELGRRYADKMLPAVDSIYVTKFKGNKESAISFTFDDGDEDHALLVAPELEKRGFRGTFWIIGSKIDNGDSVRPRLTWEQIKDMSDRGHEMSNHSWNHGKLVLMTPEEAKRDIEMNDSAILAHTGKKPVSFCYPFNSTRNWLIEIAEEGRVGTRLHQTGIGQQNNKMTPEKISKWVDQVVATGDWGITMSHGITTGYDKWHTPQDFWDMLDNVKSQEDKIWVAPFKDVAAYERERDNTIVNVTTTATGYILETTCNLDKHLFTLPLTVAIKGDWKEKNILVRKENSNIAFNNDGELLLVDMQPFSDKVEILIE
ncbi:MAG: polysaccharide deacetylase family protein [Muribaculum sp.]|nr:polysaccharide deacetylase family protein [Muribaculum sp.]